MEASHLPHRGLVHHGGATFRAMGIHVERIRLHPIAGARRSPCAASTEF